jgi:hypothetical protein
VINRWIKDSPVAGTLFQAVKKTVESSRMTPDAAIRELYGAINYLSAGILLLEEILAENPPVNTEALNAEVRRIEQKMLTYVEKEGLFLPGGEPVTDHPDEMAVFEFPLCEDCFYMNILPGDLPCRKCIDKPYKPQFTRTDKVYKVRS